MILATHGIVGGAIGYLLPRHPIAAFFLGFASHFVLDAIPHWHYPVLSEVKHPEDHMKDSMDIHSPYFPFDLAHIALDALTGAAVVWYFFHPALIIDPASISVASGMVGAILPDVLLFLAWEAHESLLVKLQRFHMWIHSKVDIDDRHVLGITTQALFAALMVWIALMIH
ncbi:MAG: hypothetical protein KGI60_04235 [Patescibacteria group bacterium]|nr:hypothetical protein [Patescibacteria group bacterium]